MQPCPSPPTFATHCLSFIPPLSLHPFTLFPDLRFPVLPLVLSCSLCMYIYKSAHNWCLGRSKEQRGREAIRGIKRGAASQPSFTGQWSKSNWVLFCGRTHTYVTPSTHTHTHTHGDSIGATYCCGQAGLWDRAGLSMTRAEPQRDKFMTPQLCSPNDSNS